MQLNRPIVQIFAKSIDNVIGNRTTNRLPFKSRVDLEAFKRYTEGNIVIMGRKTADSLNYQSLPNRINIVLSHELTKNSIPGFIVYNDVNKLLTDLQNPELFDLSPYQSFRNTTEEIVYIIGGKIVYDLFEEYYHASIVTKIDINIGNKIDNVKHELSLPCYSRHEKALSLDIENDDKISSHYIVYHNREQYPKSLLEVYPSVNKLSDYQNLLKELLSKGEEKKDRTGTGTLSVFGRMLHFKDVDKIPPFLTTRKLPLKSTLGELLWFINGNTNANILKDNLKCNFWNEWANEFGNIGPMYGAQWRGKTDGVDQLSRLLHDMVHNPSSRRLLVDAWNPKVLPKDGVKPNEQANIGLSALAPCHFAFQLNITRDYRVDLQWYQRSADVALGLPVNIASYYFLLCILCKAATELTDNKVIYIPRHLSVALGDAHLYNNHIEIAKELVKRRPLASASFTIPDGMIELFTSGIKLQTLMDYQQILYNNIQGYIAHPNPKIARNI